MLVRGKGLVYHNTSDNSDQTAQHALDYCRFGVDAACLAPAKDWYYHNTSDNSDQAAQHAVEYCESQRRWPGDHGNDNDGDLQCLETAKRFFYSETSDNSDQAAQHAIDCYRSEADSDCLKPTKDCFIATRLTIPTKPPNMRSTFAPWEEMATV